MNMKKRIAVLLVAMGSLAVVDSQAIAANLLVRPIVPITRSVYVYSFAETSPQSVDVSKKWMAHFLGDEPSDNLRPSADKTVRYVSEKDVNTTFEHNLATGDIRFHRGFARYLGDFVPVLPTTEEALKIADVFLQENGLLPANPTELKVAHIGGLRAMTTVDGKQAGDVVDKLITLSYSREIDGLPVIGAGSKMVIDIGEKGEVLSLTRHWRELSPKGRAVSSRDMYSMQDAERLARQQISKEFGEEVSVEIVNSQMTYFDNNGRLLQPVYAFQTKIALPDQQTPPFEYVSVIPVQKKPAEPLNLTKIDLKGLRAIQHGDAAPTEQTQKSD